MSGGKWKFHRCDSLSWEITQYDDTSGHGVLIVEIVSQRSFRKVFLHRFPSPGRLGHSVAFIRPRQGLAIYTHDCHIVSTKRSPLRYTLVIRCLSCKEEIPGKQPVWHFAEDPTKRITEVTVDG
jgi:hypothetical protein